MSSRKHHAASAAPTPTTATSASTATNRRLASVCVGSASAARSPVSTLRLWYRDGLQKAVLGTFVGTLTFALTLLRGVSEASVPDIGVTVAGVAVTASVVLFLVYLDRFDSLRPIAVAWLVADAGARVFMTTRPPSSGPAAEATTVGADGPPALVVRTASAGAIQAVDRRGLLATAIRHDCVLVLPHAVGDIVPHGSVLVQDYGAESPATPAHRAAVVEHRRARRGARAARPRSPDARLREPAGRPRHRWPVRPAAFVSGRRPPSRRWRARVVPPPAR